MRSVRLDTLLWTVGGVSACGVALVIWGVVSQVNLPQSDRRTARRDMQQLRHAIDVLARTWNPAERELVLTELRSRREAIASAIIEVVEDPRHVLRIDAARLAGELQLGEARGTLIGAVRTGPDDLVKVAVPAVEAIAPWTRTALADVLRDGSHAQRLAVLAICAEREDRPTDAIEELLAADDPDVQRAALGALPTQLSDNALSTCILLAEHESLGPAAHAVLGKSQLTAKQAEMVGERAFGWSPATQLAVLGGCQGSGDVFDALAWKLARSGDAAVRVKAFETLDRAKCADIERVRGAMFGLPEEGLYWAARCLLRGGERDGLRLLIDLASNDADGVTNARLLARVTLEDLSKISTAAGIDAWRRWVSQLDDVTTLRLSSGPPR